jgi:hypothetical protein
MSTFLFFFFFDFGSTHVYGDSFALLCTNFTIFHVCVCVCCVEFMPMWLFGW